MHLHEPDPRQLAAQRTANSHRPLTYTLNAASTVSGLSRSTLYRHAAANRLLLVKVGGRTLVNAASLHTLLGAES